MLTKVSGRKHTGGLPFWSNIWSGGPDDDGLPINLFVFAKHEGVRGIEETRSGTPPNKEHHFAVLFHVYHRSGQVALVRERREQTVKQRPYALSTHAVRPASATGHAQKHCTTVATYVRRALHCSLCDLRGRPRGLWMVPRYIGAEQTRKKKEIEN